MSRPILAHAHYTASRSRKSNRNSTFRSFVTRRRPSCAMPAPVRQRRERRAARAVACGARLRVRSVDAATAATLSSRCRRQVVAPQRSPVAMPYPHTPHMGFRHRRPCRARATRRMQRARFLHANRGIRIATPYGSVARPPSAGRRRLVHRLTAYPQGPRPAGTRARRRRSRPIPSATNPAAWRPPPRRAPEAAPRGRDTGRP